MFSHELASHESLFLTVVCVHQGHCCSHCATTDAQFAATAVSVSVSVQHLSHLVVNAELQHQHHCNSCIMSHVLLALRLNYANWF